MLRRQRSIVKKAILLDPVGFLLSHPDVAFNVLYRKPSNLFTTLAANTVFWELYTANALMRYFPWYHNVLWLDELPDQCVVMLSSDDDIADARTIRCYLEEYQKANPTTELKLVWLDGFFHGSVLLSRSVQMQIMSLL